MDKYSYEFLGKTVLLWQPFSSSILSYEDAREITENIIRLFSLLSEWKHKDDEKTKIEKIKTFMVLNDITKKHLNGGIENLKAVNKLFGLMESWIFKKSNNNELIECFENMEYYVVADKHRTIVSKMNEMLIDGFITSNPTTYEKFENQNFGIKAKLNLAHTLKEFNLHKNYIAVNN